MGMSSRKEKILRAVVDSYIASCEPVSSSEIRERHLPEFSSATIRNELSALEDMGFLEQPHTSAGRIPSAAGYRLYVDELMSRANLAQAERARIDAAMRRKMDRLERMLAEAGRLAAEITRQASYTVPPLRRYGTFEQFVLFKTDSQTFACIVVTAGSQVNSHAIHQHEPIDEIALAQLTDALNAMLVGYRFDQITPELYVLLEHRSDTGARYLPAVIVFLRELHGVTDDGIVVEGAKHLLAYPEYNDIVKARRMLDYLSDKHSLAQLPKPEPGRGVNVVIGPENVAAALQDASVVMATYQIGDMQGFIGLIGPTRMDYGAVTSKLAYVARRLETLLHNDNQIAEDNQHE